MENQRQIRELATGNSPSSYIAHDLESNGGQQQVGAMFHHQASSTTNISKHKAIYIAVVSV